jgi:hypothetical protein
VQIRNAIVFASFTLVVVGGMAYGGAAIGMVTGTAAFSVNGSSVRGSATLFDGATVRSGAAPSNLRLADGAKFELSANSQVQAFGEHIVLEEGYGDFQPAGGARVESRGLSIVAAEPGSVGRVAIHDAKLVQVATSHGLFRVYNSTGILVANVAAGTALDFEPQGAGGSPVSTVSGCLLKKNNQFGVYDQVSQTFYVVQGANVDFNGEWGNRVEATGTALAAGQPGSAATQTVQVTKLTRTGTGGCLSVASTIGAQLPSGGGGAVPAGTTAPPVVAHTGMSAGTKVAIAAAVAGGAVVGIVLAVRSGN